MAYLHYDKDEIKGSLDLEQVASFVSYLGGDPIIKENYFVARTICHNGNGEGSHKLYYYENTTLFKCYTNCDTMDIFELVIKMKSLEEETWTLPQAMEFVASFFGIAGAEVSEEDKTDDWKVLNNYERIAHLDTDVKSVELKVYDDAILKYYPRPRIIPWEEEGITREVMLDRGIAYNPTTGGILIPHYDMNNRLVGIRERTLLKENEKRGKYMPSIINKIQYSHPLSFNLYGLEKSKDNISSSKIAIVVEAEKSVLKYESFFGLENSIACATCGGNLINFQFQLLQSLGVREIVIGFDKDFIDKNDENFIKVVNKLKNIEKKYGCFVQISFLFDKEDLLGYKDSPLDKGPEVFQYLFANRIKL